MKSPCDEVAERLALGESLEPSAEHIARCAACARLIELPRRLAAAHADVDPGLGFSARMTVGAQQQLAARRRQRITAGLGATVLAGALGAFVILRAPAARTPSEPPQPALASQPQPEAPPPDPAAEAGALGALVELADTARSSRVSADWRALERPLRGYRKLVKSVRHDDAETVEGESP